MKSSSCSGFFKLSPEDRLKEVSEFSGITKVEQEVISIPGALDMEKADHMIENVIGTFQLPMGVALNFKINNKDYIIPMVVEEPSVVAAASNAAKMARESGGFFASNTGSVMIGTIQLVDTADPYVARTKIYENRLKIIEICNAVDPVLIEHGGGVEDIEVKIIETFIGKMVIVHLHVNTLDAMGANAVNSMAEAVAPYIEEISGGKAHLKILSNLSIYRLARSRATFKKETLGDERVVDRIIAAYAYAASDPFRAATHNKGIMNGITPVVMATGNDTRAIEAGAHAYAARAGQYTSLTTWEKDKNGDLTGTIEIPMAVGLVGGATKIHPAAQAAVKLLGVKSAGELGEVIATVGLAQNFAAIRALATEGIQRGHMSLHARNIASVAGAKGEVLEAIVKKMVGDKKINLEYAQELIKKWPFL